MRTILLHTPKGGSGKSTLARELAIAATLAGRRAAMVDLDPRGSDWAACMHRLEPSAAQGASGVHHCIQAGQARQPRSRAVTRQVCLDHLVPWILATQRGAVPAARDHIMAAGKKTAGNPPADEAAGAEHQYAHGSSPFGYRPVDEIVGD
jgi:hypothetical protein